MFWEQGALTVSYVAIGTSVLEESEQQAVQYGQHMAVFPIAVVSLEASSCARLFLVSR